MTREEMYIALEQAQELLNRVYGVACNANLPELERLMSMADTMICEAYEEIECGETAEYLKEQDETE